MFNTDVSTFLRDMGSPTSWTPAVGPVVSGPMLFDRPDESLDGGQVNSSEFKVTFETAAWPGLKREEVLVIGGDGGGSRYRLQTFPMALDDGLFSSAQLTKERA